MIASSWGYFASGYFIHDAKIILPIRKGNEYEKKKNFGMAHGNGNGHRVDAGNSVCKGW